MLLQNWCAPVADAWIGLGTNLGDRAGTMRAALTAITEFAEVVAVSSFYETEPVGYADQPVFLNAAAHLRTTLSPRDQLSGLLHIERRFGRERTIRNGPRIIDLDILFYGAESVHEPGLEIPHPRLHERRFVLAPLAELAPDLVHPTLGHTMSELLAALPPGEWVRRI